MTGTQKHWIALVAMDDQYTFTVYDPYGKAGRVITTLPTSQDARYERCLNLGKIIGMLILYATWAGFL